MNTNFTSKKRWKHLLSNVAMGLSASLLFTACGPDVDFDNIKIPPLEDYQLGLGLIDGDIQFKDFLDEDDLTDVIIEEDGSMYFEYKETIDVATIDDIVDAFGADNPESFFSADFELNLGGVPVPPQENGFNFIFTEDLSNCQTSSNSICVPLSSDSDGTVSMIRLTKGTLNIDVRGEIGHEFTITFDNLGKDGLTTRAVSGFMTHSGTNTVSLDLTNALLNMENHPTIHVKMTSSQGNEAFTLENLAISNSTADQIEIYFKDGKEVSVVEMPTTTIDTDYFSDIFPEGTELSFANSEISFAFNNPIGTGGTVDMTDKVYASLPNGMNEQIYFSSAPDADDKSQLVEVPASEYLEQPQEIKKYIYDSDALLSQLPTEININGEIRYDVPVGSSVHFSTSDQIKVNVYTKVPFHFGFSNYAFADTSELDLGFEGEIREVNKAIIRSQVLNELPIAASMSILTFDENKTLTSIIKVDGGIDGQKVIPAATTDDKGENASPTNSYIETDLTEQQLNAILTAKDISFSLDMLADADENSIYPDPVEIKNTQKMNLKFGVFIDGTVVLEKDETTNN